MERLDAVTSTGACDIGLPDVILCPIYRRWAPRHLSSWLPKMTQLSFLLDNPVSSVSMAIKQGNNRTLNVPLFKRQEI